MFLSKSAHSSENKLLDTHFFDDRWKGRKLLLTEWARISGNSSTSDEDAAMFRKVSSLSLLSSCFLKD